MNTTLETQEPQATLEEEFHQLEEDEHRLEQRTNQLSLREGLIAVFAVFGVILGVVALTIALIANGKKTSRATGSSAVAAPAPRTAGMSNGMMGGSAAKGVVSVTLGEMFVRPSATSVQAGRVTFRATNMGMVTHELMIERMPLKMEAPGKPVEDAAQGMVQDMGPGETGKMTVNLKPGKYQLFCNVPGHYAAGQHIAFSVTPKA